MRRRKQPEPVQAPEPVPDICRCLEGIAAYVAVHRMVLPVSVRLTCRHGTVQEVDSYWGEGLYWKDGMHPRLRPAEGVTAKEGEFRIIVGPEDPKDAPKLSHKERIARALEQIASRR